MLAVIWIATTFMYIFLAVGMPVIVEITEVSTAEMHATACMTQFPGTVEAVESAPVWMWFIPGLVGIVATVILLRQPEY